jgi:hypothetical protein
MLRRLNVWHNTKKHSTLINPVLQPSYLPPRPHYPNPPHVMSCHMPYAIPTSPYQCRGEHNSDILLPPPITCNLPLPPSSYYLHPPITPLFLLPATSHYLHSLHRSLQANIPLVLLRRRWKVTEVDAGRGRGGGLRQSGLEVLVHGLGQEGGEGAHDLQGRWWKLR